MIGFLVFFTCVKALGVEFIRPISGGGDRLMFLRGKVPDSIVLPQDKGQTPGDLETSSSSSNTLEKLT